MLQRLRWRRKAETEFTIPEIIWIETFFPVPVGFCPSSQAWEKQAQAAGMKGNDALPPTFTHTARGACQGFHVPEGGSLILIHINDLDDPVEVIEVVAHECMHVVQKIFDHIAEPNPGGEIEAYLMGYLVREVISAYSSTVGKGKKWV